MEESFLLIFLVAGTPLLHYNAASTFKQVFYQFLNAAALMGKHSAFGMAVWLSRCSPSIMY